MNQKVEITMQELLTWDKKVKNLCKQLKEANDQKKELGLQLQNTKQELADKTKMLELIQDRRGLPVEGLEERCKALEKILEETLKKNRILETVMLPRDENVNIKTECETCKSKTIQLEKKSKQIECQTFAINELEKANESLIQQLDRVRLETEEYSCTKKKLRRELETALMGLTEKTKVAEELSQELAMRELILMRSVLKEFKTEPLKLVKTNTLDHFLSGIHDKLLNVKDLFEKIDKYDVNAKEDFKAIAYNELQILLETVAVEKAKLQKIC